MDVDSVKREVGEVQYRKNLTDESFGYRKREKFCEISWENYRGKREVPHALKEGSVTKTKDCQEGDQMERLKEEVDRLTKLLANKREEAQREREEAQWERAHQQ